MNWKDTVSYLSITYSRLDTLLATFYLSQLLSCNPRATCVFSYLWLAWAWPAERSQLVIPLASEVSILMQCLECFCWRTPVWTHLLFTYFQKSSYSSLTGQGYPSTAIAEPKPQGFQTAAGQSSPWRLTLSWCRLSLRCHLPLAVGCLCVPVPECNVKFLCHIVKLVVLSWLLGGFSVWDFWGWCLRGIVEVLGQCLKEEKWATWAAGWVRVGSVAQGEITL